MNENTNEVVFKNNEITEKKFVENNDNYKRKYKQCWFYGIYYCLPTHTCRFYMQPKQYEWKNKNKILFFWPQLNHI